KTAAETGVDQRVRSVRRFGHPHGLGAARQRFSKRPQLSQTARQGGARIDCLRDAVAATQSPVIESVYMLSHQSRDATKLAHRVAGLAEEEIRNHAQPNVAEILGQGAGSLPRSEGRVILADEVEAVGPV